MSVGKRITFCQLLDADARIEIPIIQRDYAQGRATAAEVREQFLATIYSKLASKPEELEQPLDLDFVYGSLEGDSPKKFYPLDGQQRLTTLFLLHWYLACLDGRSTEFRTLMLEGEHSRFTYQTRTSSTEFFHALAKASVDFDKEIINLSKTIQDCSWFFLSWRQDPTIQSALVMLDEIHKHFKTAEGFYARLIRTDEPYITFQFLNLVDFGLSDELYIKMNARGKPLTAFENFKARLEQQIEKILPEETKILNNREVSVKDYFSHKVDTQWADLFWSYRDRQLNVIDEKIMNFIRSLAAIHYPINRQDWLKGLEELRDSNIPFSYLKYEETGCFTRDFINVLIPVVDFMSTGDKGIRRLLKDTAYYDEEAIFKKSLDKMNARSKTGLEYEESVMFSAYCSFIDRHQNDSDAARLYEWMRVIGNLAVNTPYNNPDQFRDSLVSVNALVAQAETILDFFAADASYKSIKGFYAQQIREEHIKAILILKNDAWKKAIQAAEQHGYFRGQIEFILSFSGVLDYYLENGNCDWGAEQDPEYSGKFVKYLERASAVFDNNGLKAFPDYLWERALLAIGDYMLYGRSNSSFLDNGSRETSWKRLLRGEGRVKGQNINEKRDIVKAVLDQFNVNDPIGSLKTVIDTAVINDPWRRMIVERPETITYCLRSMIRRNADGNIYLLSKIQMNGYHRSLYSYYVKLSILDPKKASGALSPFTYVSPYDSLTEVDEPFIRLGGCKLTDGKELVVDIFYLHGQYSLNVSFSNGGELPKDLREKLSADLKFQQASDEESTLIVSMESVSSQIESMLGLINSYIQGQSKS